MLILFRFITGVGNITSTGMIRYANYETIGIIICTSLLFIIPIHKWNFKYWFFFIFLLLINLFFIAHRSSLIAILIVVLASNYLNNDKIFIRFIKNSFIVYLFGIISLSILMIYNSAVYQLLERVINTSLQQMKSMHLGECLYGKQHYLI